MSKKETNITIVKKIIEQVINRENITVYRISKETKISEKTIKKILKNTGSRINNKTIEKLLVLKILSKEEKKTLNALIKSSTKKDKHKERFGNEIAELILENKKLKKELKLLEEMNNMSNDYLQNRKVGVFSTDLETRTFLITKLWDFNKTVFEEWSDFKLLLDVNGRNENKKLKKGLKSVMETLKEIFEYIENMVFDAKDYEEKNTIILEEE
ncbi:hypothetical protein [Leptotrichia trevisanii]|uniref:hypothetical protein n=1 Tax=Leptotrichia trevisanii TaxID=109328 RepID=UPI0026EDEFA7|nr:hypothetical protein [Leptotrichia trevisanii]